MKMETRWNDIDDLIGKMLAGEASSEERAELQEWIAQSASNKKYFDDLKLIFEKATTSTTSISFDADKAWMKMKGLLVEPRTKTVWFRSWNRTLRLAAGIVMMAAGGYLAFLWFSKPVERLSIVSGLDTLERLLPDGSEAVLNRHTKLDYEYNPRKGIRKVTLEGEGYFTVNQQKEIGFLIKAQELLVKDIGTSFNVSAYADRDTVEVVVEAGEVQIYTLTNPGIRLRAGETGMYSKSRKEFHRLAQPDANALAYKTGVLVFNNADLSTVITTVNEVYRANIQLANDSLATCRITVTFKNDTLETIVDVIAATLGLKVTRTGAQILLDGTGCTQ